MSDASVSRETAAAGTAPSAPEAAARLVGDRLPLLLRYADLLAGAGVARGLIGPRECDRLWDRHLLNCAVVAEAAPPGAHVADVGTGAGLPGLVWAICRPDLTVTLVEPLLRRTTFLSQARDLLELATVEVVRARAEELHGSRTFDVVTSRAVASLDRLAGWCLPLVRRDGWMVAMKGSSAQREVDALSPVVSRLGGSPAQVRTYGGSVLEQASAAVAIRKVRDAAAPTGGLSRTQRRKERSGR